MPGSTSSILFDLSLLRQFKLQPWLSHHCMVFLVQPTSILTSVEVFNLLWSLTFLRQQFLLNSDVINGHGILTVEGIFARVYPLAVVLLCRGTCLQSDYLIWVVRLLVWVKGFGQILAFERLMTAVMQLLSTLFFTQFLLQQWINHNTWTIVTVLGQISGHFFVWINSLNCKRADLRSFILANRKPHRSQWCGAVIKTRSMARFSMCNMLNSLNSFEIRLLTFYHKLGAFNQFFDNL